MEFMIVVVWEIMERHLDEQLLCKIIYFKPSVIYMYEFEIGQLELS